MNEETPYLLLTIFLSLVSVAVLGLLVIFAFSPPCTGSAP